MYVRTERTVRTVGWATHMSDRGGHGVARESVMFWTHSYVCMCRNSLAGSERAYLLLPSSIVNRIDRCMACDARFDCMCVRIGLQKSDARL